MKKLFVSCEEATQLISKSMDHKLGFGDRLALNLRLMLCSVTRRAKHQMELVNRAVADFWSTEEKRLENESVCMPDDCKQKIQQMMSEEHRSDP